MAGILDRQINLRQTAPDTYTASWHVDWTVVNALHGGHVAAIIHQAAATHLITDPTLKKANQPDVLKLHLEFLRSCGRYDSTIAVTVLRTGKTSSTLQLQLSQNNQLKVLALATSTNFENSLGPTAPTSFTLLPPPKPTPNFHAILSSKPDPYWLPARLTGDILPYTSRMLILYPRGSPPAPNVWDSWYRWDGDERMDATYLALMTDNIPSMSDTLLRNGGLYDAHACQGRAEVWAEMNPGVPVDMRNSFAQAMEAKTLNSTVTLDLEHKRRVGEGELEWLMIRTATKMLEGGRMDVDVTLIDEKGDIVVSSQQLILVLEAQRKFRDSRGGAAKI